MSCRTKRIGAVGACGGLLLLASMTPGVCRAELADYDFSLRFPAAISRFASYADVAAMGNAQAATEWSSSINPAAAAWPHADRKYRDSFAPQYTSIAFDSGSRLHVASEALTFDTGDRGVFLPAAAQIFSNHAADRNGVGFKFDAKFFQLQWGKLVQADTAVGANVSATLSDSRYDVAGNQIARSRGESYSVRVGALRKVAAGLRVGVVAEAGWAPARTDVWFFDPAANRGDALRVRDTTRNALVRTGVAWEYCPGSTFAVDYQGGVFDNDSGRFRVHRFPVGIEHMVVKDILFARAGVTLDTRGNAATTAGIGLSLGLRTSLDMAYQHGMFPELRPEFGAAKTYTVSLAFAF